MPALAALLLLLLSTACSQSPDPPAAFALTAIPLPFRHANGASPAFRIPEIMGSGVALLDFDGDGDLDILLVQGHSGGGSHALLRNDGGTFVDATASAGLASTGWGMGAAAADFDNDGHTDLLVTALDGTRLFRNLGNGTFEDATAFSPGLDLPGRWATSASFFDYDGDGWLDLFVGLYIEYSEAANKTCHAPTGEIDYCTPRVYRSQPSRLFHNEHGRFRDVTRAAGIDRASGPALGVVAIDANGDGALDIFVANDSSANHLWINRRDGTFVEQALQFGLAYAENGLAKAGMGVAPGDYDGDGDEDLIVLNLMREGATLFANQGRSGFADVSAASGIHAATLDFTGFGTGWVDMDRDGRLELFLANGAVTRREEQRGKPRPFLEHNLLLRQGARGFAPVSVPALARPGVYRGVAMGDLDGDGDIDIVVTENGGGAYWLRNDAPSSPWIAVDAPAGARIELETAEGPAMARIARSDGSYLSSSSPRVLLPLPGGTAREVRVSSGRSAEPRRFPGSSLRSGTILTVR